MKILLKNIKEERTEYTGEVECKSIENNGDEILFTKPIIFNGTLRKGEDFVEIEGTIETEYETNCHACGEKANCNMKFDIFETFRREPAEDEYELVGSEVDFDEMILENIRLNLPIKILCKEECKGICTMCGKNLNLESCDCVPPEEKKESPFAGLKDLFNK